MVPVWHPERALLECDNLGGAREAPERLKLDPHSDLLPPPLSWVLAPSWSSSLRDNGRSCRATDLWGLGCVFSGSSAFPSQIEMLLGGGRFLYWLSMLCVLHPEFQTLGYQRREAADRLGSLHAGTVWRKRETDLRARLEFLVHAAPTSSLALTTGLNYVDMGHCGGSLPCHCLCLPCGQRIWSSRPTVTHC